MKTQEYSTGDVVRFTGIPFRTVDFWARTGFLTPSIAVANGPGTDRKYSFQDLVILSVLWELRKIGFVSRAIGDVVGAMRRCNTADVGEWLVITPNNVLIASAWHPVETALRCPEESPVVVVNLVRLIEDLERAVK